MPLPFDLDRRWGGDRRKDDKDHDKKKDHEKKKKYKTKTEEQMDKQIEELNQQLLEERQTTRREKLTVTRLQRELSKTISDNSLQRDAIMRDLAEERQSRLDAEKRLKEALLEGEAYKSRLEALQEDLNKMQGMLNGVLEYKSKMEQLKEEHSTAVQNLESDLKKCHAHISNLEMENSNLLSECNALESKVGQEEMIKEKTILLERLRLLEAENSALVLENENQREQYERCLDEVANQVVQALFMQKDLKEECVKLHNRIRELEQQNINLKCLFERERQCYSPLTPLQGCIQHPFISLLSPTLNGPSSTSTPRSTSHSHSSAPTSRNSSPVRPRPNHRIPGPDRLTRPEQQHSGTEAPAADSSAHPAPSCDSAQGSPSHGAKPVLYQLHPRSPNNRYSATRCHEHINAGYKETSPDTAYPITNGVQFPDSTDPLTQHHRLTENAMNMPSPQRGEVMYTHNCQAFAEYRHSRLSSSSNSQHHQSSMVSFNVSENGVGEESGEIIGMEDMSWEHALLSPASQCLGEIGKPPHHLPNGVVTSPAKALALRNSYANSVVERRIGSNISGNEAAKNGLSLGEQYTKPFVHAPFHYAQSLLQELKDISSSVKSFETLTLEPKAGMQQKRKASLEINSPYSRQKLVRSQMSMPPDHVISVSASEQGSAYDAGPAFAQTFEDSSCSMTSSESIEALLEKQASITPFPETTTENPHDFHQQVEPFSNEMETNRVPYQQTQANKSSEPQLHQYYKDLNDSAVSEKASQFQGNSEPPFGHLYRFQNNCVFPGPSTRLASIEKSVAVSETVPNSTLQQTNYACQLSTEHDLRGRPMHTANEESLQHYKNVVQPTCEGSSQLDSRTRLCQSLFQSDQFVTSQKTAASFHNNGRLQEDSGLFSNSPHSPNTSKNTILLSKSGYSEITSPPPSTLAADRVSNTTQNSIQPQQLHLQRHSSDFYPSTQSPHSPNRHRNSTFPRPHRHLSDSDSRHTKADQQLTTHSTALHGIRPPNSLPDDLRNFDKPRQSMSAPTSPLNEHAAIRAHQRHIARKLSPRVHKQPKQESHEHFGRISQADIAASHAENPDGSKVVGIPSSSQDFKIPSRDIQKENSVSSQNDVHNSETPTSTSPQKIILDQTSITIQPSLNSETNETCNEVSEQLTNSSPLGHVTDESPSTQNKKFEPAGEVEDVIMAYSSQRDDRSKLLNATLPESSQDLAASTESKVFDDCLNASEENKQESDETNRKEGKECEVKETGKKSRDNRVGSFMRANTPPVVSKNLREPGTEPSSKLLVTNIDDMPIRGFNPDVTPKTKNRLVNNQSGFDAIVDCERTSVPSVELKTSAGQFQELDETVAIPDEGCETEDKVPEKQTADDSNPENGQKDSPFLIGTLGSSPRQPGKHQAISSLQDNHRRVVSDPACQHSQSYESLQSNQSEGSVEWGSPGRNGTAPRKPATPLSEILWSGSDSDDEEENVNFVEMWKARNSSPIKLPEWNPRKSVEDYKKKMQESLLNSSKSLERPDSLTSSTSSEQWILNYPLDKISPPSSLERPSKTSPKKEPSRSSSVKNPTSKSSDSKPALCSSRSAPNKKTNGSFKRDGSAFCRKGSGSSSGNQVRSSSSENSSLGENSLMADFVSSIMTEITSTEFGKSCVSLDSALKDKKKVPKMGISDKQISPSTRAKCKSLPSHHLGFRLNLVSCSPKNPSATKIKLASGEKVTKNQSVSSGSKLIKSKLKESGIKTPLSGIPKAITENNFKSYKEQETKKSRQREQKQHSEGLVQEDSTKVQVKKREPKGRSRIPKLIRNSFSKKKTSKGADKKTIQDDHKIQMTCGVPCDQNSRNSEKSSQEKWMQRNIKRMPSRSPSSSCERQPAKKSDDSIVVIVDVPFIDTSPTVEQSDKKCNVCLNDTNFGSICNHRSKSNPKEESSIHSFSVSENGDFSKCSPNSAASVTDQKVIRDIQQGRLCSTSDLPLSPKIRYAQLNSNNKGSMERSPEKNQQIDGGKEFKVPLVNEDMMEDFDAEELCDEESEGAGENSAQLTEKERANLLDSLFESDTDDEGTEGGESLDTSSDSHPDEKQFLKLLGGDKCSSGWKRHAVRPQATYCHVSILQLDLHELYMRFGDKEKEALSSFSFLQREGAKLEKTEETSNKAKINNNANDLQFSLVDDIQPSANQQPKQQGLAFIQPFEESLSVSDDVSCYSQSSSTPSLSLHD